MERGYKPYLGYIDQEKNVADFPKAGIFPIVSKEKLGNTSCVGKCDGHWENDDRKNCQGELN